MTAWARAGRTAARHSSIADGFSLRPSVAAALSDPARRADARTLLRQHFVEPTKRSPKALLASAPIEGIELDRGRDVGRDVDL